MGWLVTITWSEDGAPVEETAQRTIVRLAHWNRPDVLLVTIDSEDKARVVPDHAVASVRAAVPEGSLVDAVDSASAFGRRLMEDAFAAAGKTCPSSTWFKNTIAYMWGVKRLAELGMRFGVHIDDDIELWPLRDDGSRWIDVVSLDSWAWVRVPRAVSVSWIDVALEALEADDTLLSVHPLPLGPTPLGEHESRMHDAATNCTVSGGCSCDRPSRAGLTGNAFAEPRAVYGAPHLCGHTVGGYRLGAPHFSCQAFVLNIPRFMATWPLKEVHRDVETLIEDAAASAKLTPLFLPPSFLGVVKHEKRR